MFGWWTTGALSAWLSSVLPLGIDVVIEPSARLILAAAAFAVVSTICFAVGPAWSLSRPDLVSDLTGARGFSRASARSARLKTRVPTGSLLVVGQVAVSLALVAAGGLFMRAAINAAGIDPGFAVDRHLVVAMDPSLAGYAPPRTRAIYHDVLARVRSLPGVEHASLGSIVPFGEFREGRAVRLKREDDGVGADFTIVGADYFDTMGLHLLRGRTFTAAEEEAGSTAKVAVIDRQLARRVFADADPLGRQLLVQPREGEALEPFNIVGVVSEMKHDLFDLEPKPHLLRVNTATCFERS